MNSKQSISECMEHGCPVIEVDVNFTSDGVPVLTHWFAPDEDIMFFDKPSLQEFLSADYPGGHYPMILDELMEKVKDYDGVFLIDVKMGEEREVAEWFASHYSFEQKQKLIFQVHDVRFLKELHEKNIFGYLHYNADIQTLETLLPYFKKYDVHTVSVSDWEVRDEKSIANLRNAGLHVYVYTVNHARRMKTLFEYGVDGVFTDCYGELVQELQ